MPGTPRDGLPIALPEFIESNKSEDRSKRSERQQQRSFVRCENWKVFDGGPREIGQKEKNAKERHDASCGKTIQRPNNGLAHPKQSQPNQQVWKTGEDVN